MPLTAAATQVPWHAPGAAAADQCCCEPSCAEQPETGFSTALRQVITADSYLALYAGGYIDITFDGSASISSSGPCAAYSISGTWSRKWRATLEPVPKSAD